jgi:hypothetical protein
MLFIAKDLRKRRSILIDDSRSRAVCIFGKRGSGKSYTLGVFAEELFSSKRRPLIIMVDPMGIYWMMAKPQGRLKRNLPVCMIVPGELNKRYDFDVILEMQHLGIEFKRISIEPFHLSETAWLNLFDLSLSEPQGISLSRAIRRLRKAKPQYFISDIIEQIKQDELSQEKTKQALVNRQESASSWGVFSDRPQEESSAFSPDKINILNLSALEPSALGLRNLILDILLRRVFEANLLNKTRQELGLDYCLRRIWLLIDEAHQFVPQAKKVLSKDILIRWVKEGRQPGLSCVFATQQPKSLDEEALSQSDLIIVHRITNVDDILSVNRLTQDYMPQELRLLLRQIKKPGEAVLLDDAKEDVLMVKIRRRLSTHPEESI